jgi:hypothetical protein
MLILMEAARLPELVSTLCGVRSVSRATARGRCSGRDVPRCREDVGGASRKRNAVNQGGAKSLGTGGTSPFGSYGYNREVIRMGQDKSRNRSAVKVWDQREYRNLDDSVEPAHAISRSL